MSQIRWSLAAPFVVALLAAGCSKADSPVVDKRAPAGGSTVSGETTEGGAAPGAQAPKSEEAATGAVEAPIRMATWEEVEQLVATHKGKVVVLDIWSTWCEPCIRDFHHLVELHRKHGEQVVCVSLNCDYIGAKGEKPEDARPQIETFLRKQGATFENVISTTPADPLLAALDAAAVPVVRVYDQQGQLKQQFVNEGQYGDEGFSYDQHITPLVEQLLEK